MTSVRRRSLLAAGALALAWRPARAQDTTTVRVAGPTQEGMKNVYYALRSGLFRKAGLAVEVITVQSGAAAMAALSGGSAEVAFTSVTPFFQACARGLPFVIVAPGQQYVSDAFTQALFVKKASAIQRGSDLSGKVVAVQSIRDQNWAATCAWVDATGGDSRAVRFIELPLSAVIPALVEGRVDVATIVAPYMEQALATGELRLLARHFDYIAKRFESAVFISTKDVVDTKRDTMRRFARAMHDAAMYVNAHPAETIDLIASFTGVDPAVVAKGTRTTDPEFVDARDIQPVLDLLYKYKLVDHTMAADELIAPTALRPRRR
jgi:ABC-type nitrate/sulfonate/bicarbonate transport system substrate-binding protein